MNIENINKKIKDIFGNHPILDEEISAVESALNVKFPDIFVDLNKYCSYEYSHLVGFFNFGMKDQESVIGETLGVRKYYGGNSEKFVVLYSDDAGIFLLNMGDEKASVIWCSIYDIENVFNDQPLEYDYDFFPTFADFFTYLLDQEEERLREEAAEN